MIKKNVSFEQTCPTIGFSFELMKEEKSFYPEILIIKVEGNYRDGSEGDNDAKLIKGTMDLAVSLWNPEAVLLDLTEFKYEWGDYIDYIFDGPERKKPFTIVVGSDCRPAFSTLVHGLETDEDIVDNEDFFDSIEQATNKLQAAANSR